MHSCFAELVVSLCACIPVCGVGGFLVFLSCTHACIFLSLPLCFLSLPWFLPVLRFHVTHGSKFRTWRFSSPGVFYAVYLATHGWGVAFYY